MVLEVGGSISFAPDGDDAKAKWLGYDTRHMLTELTPKPDQITIAIGSASMNMVEMSTDDDLAGTHMADPKVRATLWGHGRRRDLRHFTLSI